MFRISSIAQVIFVLFVLVACSTTANVPSRRATAMNLCQEAYDVYWGSNWDRVAELATRAIESDPEFAWPYSLRGVARTQQGRYAQAVQDLTMAISLQPDFQPAYTNRAIANMLMQQYDTAEMDLIEAMKLDRYDVIAPVHMAELCAMELDVDGACRYLKKAVQNGFYDLVELENREVFEPVLEDECFEEIREYLTPKQASTQETE